MSDLAVGLALTPEPWPVVSTVSDAELNRLAATHWDVVVVGSGNAALVAAITARTSGSTVLMLERAPRHMRGGNTRHTRNIRCAHDTGDGFTPGTYSVDELCQDLQSVGGASDAELARFAAVESQSIPQWMASHGVRWQKALSGTLGLSRTNRFFLGGGTALVNHYAKTAEAAGIEIAYGTAASDIRWIDDRRAGGVVVETGSGRTVIPAGALILASGGFEANRRWLKLAWGEAADNFIVRGTPHNDGSVLARMVGYGAAVTGDPRGFHAIAVDARAPRFDGGIATRLDAVPFSIVVDENGHRFADEGSDIWPKRYASWGKLIAGTPHQVAYAVYDSPASSDFMPSLYPPFVGRTVQEAATAAGLDPVQLVETVDDYNAHTDPEGQFDAARLDGCGTRGLLPPKSNWARPIVSPPFFILPLRPGVTFTYMGLSVNETAHVLDANGGRFVNVHAAGEVMSGNILSSGYLAGFGLTIGSVFGRIAGREAASHAAH